MEEPADLGGEHEFVARLVAQEVADAALGKPEAVIGCHIEIAHTRLPGRVQCRDGRVTGALPVEPAEAGGTEAKFGHR
ncbi:hypothetical protein D9M68_435890 [compost metagenome]